MVYECEEPTEAIEETWSFVLATLRDRQQMDQLRQVTKRGLERIIKTMLPCRIKLLCAQFVLLPRLRWPLTIYEVPIWRSKNWRGLLTHLPKSGWNSPNALVTSECMEEAFWRQAIFSFAEEFKCSSVWSEMTLVESNDSCSSLAASTLATRRKWTPFAAAQQAKSDLRHRDIWYNSAEKALALDREEQRGTGQYQLIADVWLSRMCSKKSRQWGV